MGVDLGLEGLGLRDPLLLLPRAELRDEDADLVEHGIEFVAHLRHLVPVARAVPHVEIAEPDLLDGPLEGAERAKEERGQRVGDQDRDGDAAPDDDDRQPFDPLDLPEQLVLGLDAVQRPMLRHLERGAIDQVFASFMLVDRR